MANAGKIGQDCWCAFQMNFVSLVGYRISRFQLYRLTAQHSEYQDIEYGIIEADIPQKEPTEECRGSPSEPKDGLRAIEWHYSIGILAALCDSPHAVSQGTL